MQDVLAKLKEIQENYDNEDIQRAITAAEKTAVSEEAVEEETVDEAEETVEEDSVEEVHEEEVVEESVDNSDLERMIKLSGRSGVMGMHTNVIVAESVEVSEDDVSEEAFIPKEEVQVTEDREVMVRATNIDYAGPALDKLPTDVNVKVMVNPGDSEDEIFDAVADELEDRYGVKVNGFDMKMMEDTSDDEIDESFETVEEETVEVPISALSELMRLAGYEEYKIDEYANEPEEEYSSAEDQMDLGGGLNGPKKAYAAAAGGDNPMDQEPTEIEEDNKLTFEGMYKRYMTQVVEETLEEKE